MTEAGPRRFPILTVVLAALLALGALWLGGLVWFVAALDRTPPAGAPPTDAIVVLTGGSERIERGLALLMAGAGRKLFISGVPPGVERPEPLRGPEAERWLRCCIVLGHSADNTLGNALESAAWLASEHYRSLRLVTANYHMARALLEFRRVLPKNDLIIPEPVAPEGARRGLLGAWRGTAPVIITEYLKYLGALARAQVEPTPRAAGGAG